MSQNKPRFRLLVAVFAVASMIGGSFIVVANAAPGKDKGGRPGPKPSPSARPEKPAKPERPERPAKPERPERLIQTRLGFRLDVRHISPDGSVSGQARLLERVGKGFAPFAGQTLHVFVDKEEQDEVTTDAEGMAVITATGDVGGHVVQVVYEGDATHRPARRAQGFHVGEACAPPPEDDGGDEVQAFGRDKGDPGRGGPERERKPQKPCRDHDDHKGDHSDDDAKEEEEDDEDEDEDDADDDDSKDESVDTTTDGLESEDEAHDH